VSITSQQEIEKLRKLVNASGFAFQLRIAEEIRSMEHEAWQVVAQEHPWKDAETQNEGFIDIVVGQNTNYDLHRMIIECKRTRDADWVFLLPDTSSAIRGSLLRCMWVSTYPETLHDATGTRSGHHNFYVAPDSYISQFCVVRGSGEGQMPMLENLSRSVLESLECFAREEMVLWLRGNHSQRRYYVPIIVTNARLSVCKFKVGSISLVDGEIPDGEFEDVPYIRFNKSLTTVINTAEAQPRSISEANRYRHRTVLIVQASRFTELMRDWHLPEFSANPPPRW
jgi:hypothetical protein